MLIPVAALAQNEGDTSGRVPFKLSPRQHGRARIHRQLDNGLYESYNWSGYAVTGPNGSTTDVKGSWTVPAVNCTTTPGGYSSFWVGIDGFSSSTVEQIGTDSDCVSLNGREQGTPTYYAWFEFYPNPSYLIEFPNGIQVGDTITAEVKSGGASAGTGFGPGARSSGTSFTVTITDVTQNVTFSLTSSVTGAQQSSAEWIAEAPASSSGVLPLADFSSIAFNGDSATVQGSTGIISSFGANTQAILMVGENAPHSLKAQPYGLWSTNFSVMWVSVGP